MNCVRLLLCEDDDDVRLSLSELLVLRGFVVNAVSSAAAADAAILSWPFDVALLDIALPDGSGTSLARSIRARKTDVRPRLIAISGHSSTSEQIVARDAGFDMFLVKPVNEKQLLAALATTSCRCRQSEITP